MISDNPTTETVVRANSYLRKRRGDYLSGGSKKELR